MSPVSAAEFQKAVDALFARSEDAKGSFFARNTELQPGYDNMLALERQLMDVDYTHSAPALEAAITAADNRDHLRQHQTPAFLFRAFSHGSAETN